MTETKSVPERTKIAMDALEMIEDAIDEYPELAGRIIDLIREMDCENPHLDGYATKCGATTTTNMESAFAYAKNGGVLVYVGTKYYHFKENDGFKKYCARITDYNTKGSNQYYFVPASQIQNIVIVFESTTPDEYKKLFGYIEKYLDVAKTDITVVPAQYEDRSDFILKTPSVTYTNILEAAMKLHRGIREHERDKSILDKIRDLEIYESKGTGKYIRMALSNQVFDSKEWKIVNVDPYLLIRSDTLDKREIKAAPETKYTIDYSGKSVAKAGRVYFIALDDAIKIGITAGAIGKKITSLQNKGGSTLKLIGVVDTDNFQKLENALHKYFAEKHIHYGWFTVTIDEIKIALDKIAKYL